MVINSVFHFLMISISVFLLKMLNTIYDLNYDYENSLTSMLFIMSNFYLLFKDIKDKRFDLFYTVFIKVKYVNFIALICLYCFTPNKSFFSNLSGILSGYLFIFFPMIFLPKVSWIDEFEKKIGLKKYFRVYTDALRIKINE